MNENLPVAHQISANELMMDDNALNRALSLANAMASAAVTIPKHLRGNPGDCLAIVMQAAAWGMNPFAVAQKTHIVNGVLGYEAQLVNAVIQQSGAIEGRFHYEYSGSAGSSGGSGTGSGSSPGGSGGPGSRTGSFRSGYNGYGYGSTGSVNINSMEQT